MRCSRTLHTGPYRFRTHDLGSWVQISTTELCMPPSSKSAIYQRLIYQWVLFTKDDFIDGCYLPKMTSSMGAFYQRWLHWWVLSTYDDFINECYPKITSSMSATYQRYDIDDCYIPEGGKKSLHQWVLSTKMTSSAWISTIYLGCIISVLCR